MTRDRLVAAVGLLLIVAAVVLIAVAPLLLDDGYDPLRHSISESAAQFVVMAWAARTALLFSGLAVLAACVVRAAAWGFVATSAFAVFGVCWTLTAAFSTRSWVESAPFVALDDTLHSVFASAMAIIIVGGIALIVSGRTVSTRWRWATLGLVAAATFLPLVGVLYPEVAGLAQRIMFAAAYAWFARELVRVFVEPARSAARAAGESSPFR